MYCLCSENKGADQLCSYCSSCAVAGIDLHLQKVTILHYTPLENLCYDEVPDCLTINKPLFCGLHHDKTNCGFKQVRHNLACTVTEDGWRLEILDLASRGIVKTKALISFTLTAKLICAFAFAYVKCLFSHDTSHFLNKPLFLVFYCTLSEPLVGNPTFAYVGAKVLLCG